GLARTQEGLDATAAEVGGDARQIGEARAAVVDDQYLHFRLCFGQAAKRKLGCSGLTSPLSSRSNPTQCRRGRMASIATGPAAARLLVKEHSGGLDRGALRQMLYLRISLPARARVVARC